AAISPPTSYYKSKYLLKFPTLYVLHFVVRNVGFRQKSVSSLFGMTIKGNFFCFSTVSERLYTFIFR
ncbi:hypothetical protein, partial [Dapis sp. BLCC M172]|uniref:hypothetical protein n=1 Tax=Dapis sp. BLCC M172 TaxID=2975281 RepID=UPI003CFAB58F